MRLRGYLPAVLLLLAVLVADASASRAVRDAGRPGDVTYLLETGESCPCPPAPACVAGVACPRVSCSCQAAGDPHAAVLQKVYAKGFAEADYTGNDQTDEDIALPGEAVPGLTKARVVDDRLEGEQWEEAGAVQANTRMVADQPARPSPGTDSLKRDGAAASLIETAAAGGSTSTSLTGEPATSTSGDGSEGSSEEPSASVDFSSGDSSSDESAAAVQQQQQQPVGVAEAAGDSSSSSESSGSDADDDDDDDDSGSSDSGSDDEDDSGSSDSGPETADEKAAAAGANKAQEEKAAGTDELPSGDDDDSSESSSDESSSEESGGAEAAAATVAAGSSEESSSEESSSEEESSGEDTEDAQGKRLVEIARQQGSLLRAKQRMVYEAEIKRLQAGISAAQDAKVKADTAAKIALEEAEKAGVRARRHRGNTAEVPPLDKEALAAKARAELAAKDKNAAEEKAKDRAEAAAKELRAQLEHMKLRLKAQEAKTKAAAGKATAAVKRAAAKERAARRATAKAAKVARAARAVAAAERKKAARAAAQSRSLKNRLQRAARAASAARRRSSADRKRAASAAAALRRAQAALKAVKPHDKAAAARAAAALKRAKAAAARTRAALAKANARTRQAQARQRALAKANARTSKKLRAARSKNAADARKARAALARVRAARKAERRARAKAADKKSAAAKAARRSEQKEKAEKFPGYDTLRVIDGSLAYVSATAKRRKRPFPASLVVNSLARGGGATVRSHWPRKKPVVDYHFEVSFYDDMRGKTRTDWVGIKRVGAGVRTVMTAVGVVGDTDNYSTFANGKWQESETGRSPGWHTMEIVGNKRHVSVFVDGSLIRRARFVAKAAGVVVRGTGGSVAYWSPWVVTNSKSIPYWHPAGFAKVDGTLAALSVVPSPDQKRLPTRSPRSLRVDSVAVKGGVTVRRALEFPPNVNSASFTMDAWYYDDEPTDKRNDFMVLQMGAGGTHYGFGVVASAGKTHYAVGNRVWKASKVARSKGWHHFRWEMSALGLRRLIDGVVVANERPQGRLDTVVIRGNGGSRAAWSPWRIRKVDGNAVLDRLATLSLHYKRSRSGNDQWKDLSGNENHGVLKGGARFTTGNLLDTTENGSHLRIPAASTLLATNVFSVDVWFKPKSWAVTSNGGFLLTKPGQWYLELAARGKIRVYCYGLKPAGYHTSRGSIVPGRFNHAAYVWDGKYHRIYINGRLDRSIRARGKPARNRPGYAVDVGAFSASGGGNSYKYRGVTAVARFYNEYAMKPSDVALRFRGESRQFGLHHRGWRKVLRGAVSISFDQRRSRKGVNVWRDLTGNGNDASLRNGAFFGKGNAVNTVRGTAHATVHRRSWTQMAGMYFSVDVWFKPKTWVVTSNGGMLLTKPGQWYLELGHDGRIAVYCYGLKPAGYHKSKSRVLPGQYNHAAYVWDGKAHRIYINGRLDRSIPARGTPDTRRPQYKIDIGAHTRSPSAYKFRGLIASARYYNDYPMPANYVRALYNSERARFAPRGGWKGLLASAVSIHFDAKRSRIGSGTTKWRDLSENDNDALLRNGATFSEADNALDTTDGTAHAFIKSTWSQTAARFFSVDVWFKPSTLRTTSAGGMLLTKPGQWYLEMGAGGKIRVYCYGLKPAGYHTSKGSIVPGQYNHAGYVWDGKAHRIYINGRLDRSIPARGWPDTRRPQYDVDLGAHHRSPSAYKFDGLIAVARYYNDYPMPANYVRALYNSERARFVPENLLARLIGAATASFHLKLSKHAGGQWSDISGYGNHAKLETGARFLKDGSLSVSGDGTGATAPKSRSLLPTRGFTAEAWIRPSSLKVESGYGIIMSMVGSWYLSAANGGRIAVYCYGAKPAGYHLSKERWKVGQLVHVAYTYDRGFHRIYFNGRLSKAVRATGTPRYNGVKLFLGRYVRNTYKFRGQIYSARYYNDKVASPAEIRMLYQKTGPNKDLAKALASQKVALPAPNTNGGTRTMVIKGGLGSRLSRFGANPQLGISAGIRAWYNNQRVALRQMNAFGTGSYLRVISRQSKSTPGVAARVKLMPNTAYTVTLVGRMNGGTRKRKMFACPWVNGGGRNLVWGCNAGRSLREGRDHLVRLNFRTPKGKATDFRVGALISRPFSGGAFFLKSLDVRATKGGVLALSMGSHQWAANQRVAIRHHKRASGNVMTVYARQSSSTPGARINSVQLRANTNYRAVLVGRRLGKRSFNVCPWVADRRGKNLAWSCNRSRSLESRLTTVTVPFRTGRERTHNVGALFSGVKSGDAFEVVSFHIEVRSAGRKAKKPKKRVAKPPKRKKNTKRTAMVIKGGLGSRLSRFGANPQLGISAGIRAWYNNQRVALRQMNAFDTGSYLRVISRQSKSTPGVAARVKLMPNTAYTVTLVGRMNGGTRKRKMFACPWVNGGGRNLVWGCNAGRSLREGRDHLVRLNFRTPKGKATDFRVGALISRPFSGGAFFLKSLDVRATKGGVLALSMGSHQWAANQRVAIRHHKRASGNVMTVYARQSSSTPGARINSVQLRANTNYRVVLVGRRLGKRSFNVCPWVADRRGKNLAWSCNRSRSLESRLTTVTVPFRTGRERTHNVGALFSGVRSGDAFEVVSFHIERR